jgi:hypothetical protein
MGTNRERRFLVVTGACPVAVLICPVRCRRARPGLSNRSIIAESVV